MRIPITIAATAIIATGLLTGCWTGEEKVVKAEENLEQAKTDAKAEADKAAKEQAWQTYKAEAEAKIAKNDARISELKMAKQKPGKLLDGMYTKKIEELQQRNADLRTRIVNYETERSDWEAFKTEFEHDMEALGKAFEDLAVDNKK
jgi:hypothetical protein